MGTYAVTGAGSGIGQAIAEQLRQEGHRVIGVDLKGADIEGDLSDVDQRQQAVAQIQAQAPEGLNGFVPCAGVGPDTARKELLPLVNYFAAVDMVNALRPALEKKRGAVLLISSNSAKLMPYNNDYMEALLGGDVDGAVKLAATLEGQELYGGGKNALARWLRRNSAEFAQAGVRINAIAPGFTETGMTEAGMKDPVYGPAMRDFVATIPVGRPGLPQDQANAASFLLSDKASFISGAVLFVDGGHDAMFAPEQF